ncbi:FtsX-like permease family protein, partial [Saccharothrix coeruleofusca]
GEYYRQQWPLVYGLLVVAAIVALLVPLAIFVMVATRLGATGREQRLAAIRLAGGSRAQVHRIASGETLAGALLGLLVGVALYFAARPLARFIEVEGVGFFPTDLLPDPLLGVLIAVGVPVVAVGSALLGLRAVDIGPLGLSRRTEVPARRGWWRFALVGAGALVLVSISLTSDFWSVMTDPVVTLALGAGIGLVLVGTGAVLPWLVGRVSRGQVEGIAPMLALRGLRHDRNTPRVLAGVVVVLTGSLTLQVLLSAAADFTADSFGAGTADEGTGRWTLALSEPTPLRELEEAIALVGGVRRISEVRWGATTGGKPHGVVSTDCAELAHMLGVRDCAPGRAYWVHDGRDAPRPGTRTVLAGRDWTIPDYQVLIDTPSDSRLPAGLLVAGGADPVLSALRPYQLVVEGDPDAAFADRLLAATGRVDRAVRLSTGQSAQVELFTSLRSGVIGASVLLTLLAVVGLAAAAVDQVWERRRPVAVLAANGVPRRTLAAAAAWQAAVPTALGLALATPLGLGTAWLLVPSERFRVDWSEVVVTVGTAAVVVLAVSLCTLPALRSAIRPSALRTE